MEDIIPVQLELHQLDIDGDLVPVIVEIFAEDYDPNLCCNGGSYAQESFVLDFSTCDGRHCQLLIDDSSCGDFGTRFYASLTVTGEQIASANFGTMLGRSEEFSNFSAKREPDLRALNVAALIANVYIPDAEDLAEEVDA